MPMGWPFSVDCYVDTEVPVSAGVFGEAPGAEGVGAESWMLKRLANRTRLLSMSFEGYPVARVTV